jgi:5-methylthioadenosine/S-adenosylhomocysteine deaminase
VADTGATGAVIQALAELGGSGIAYLEIFGPDPREARAQFDRWQPRLQALRRYATGRVSLGVSPHAPYSVSGPLYRLVADYAAAEKLPIAVHIAESADESALLATGEGGFADNWRSRSIPVQPPGVTPIAWLERQGVLSPRTLCIHAIRADAEDLRILAGHDAAVAHCPRSNARHGHGAAPLRDFLSLGIRTGVGTDSVASVTPLDLLAEARAAQQLAGLDALRALRLCTLDAARALGMDLEIGSLVPGKWGDIAVVRLPEGVDESHLANTLLTRGTGQVAATFLAGKEVWRGTL